jgi:hypothetical protein
MNPFPVLTPPQEQVLELISAGSPISQAALTAGVHRNTVHNWLRSVQPFRLALDQAHYLKALHWREQAQQLAAAALETIHATMTDASLPAGVRLKAALAVLSLATTAPPECRSGPVLDPAAGSMPIEPRPQAAESREPLPNSAQPAPNPAAAAPPSSDPIAPEAQPLQTLPNSAQPAPTPEAAEPASPDPVAPEAQPLETLPNSAQPGAPTPERPQTCPPAPFRRSAPKVGRNDLCPCGSGKKFKRCCQPLAAGAESLDAVA